jgi:hypothetical protein
MKRRKTGKKPSVVSEEKKKTKSLSPSFWLKAAVVLQFVVLAWQFYPAPSTNGDNAKYFILGTALSELKGYRQIHPVLFPLFLGIVQFFSDTPFPAKVVIAGIGVLATVLFFYLGMGYFGYLLIPLLFLIASSSAISEYSVILMSEVPYLLLTLAALYAYDRSIHNPGNRLLFMFALLLSVLPVHCRSIGLAFSGAYIVDNLLTKRYRYALAHTVLLVGTVVIYRSMTSWDNPYMLQLFLKNSYDPEMGYVTFGEMVIRIGWNVKKYSTFLIGNSLCPFLYAWPAFLKGVFSAVCTLFVVAGLIRMLFTPLRIVSLYILLYFGILCLWQFQWSSERFLVSIVPFLFLFLLFGLDVLTATAVGDTGGILKRFTHTFRLPRIMQPARNGYIGVWIAALLLMAVNVAHIAKQAGVNRRLNADWKNFYSCADWLRINSPENTLVMSRKPELLYLRAKRSGIMYPLTHDVDKIISVLKRERIQYVVFDNFFWTRTTVRYLFPVIQSYPDMFRVAYALRGPDTYVLEFLDK